MTNHYDIPEDLAPFSDVIAEIARHAIHVTCTPRSVNFYGLPFDYQFDVYGHTPRLTYRRADWRSREVNIRDVKPPKALDVFHKLMAEVEAHDAAVRAKQAADDAAAAQTWIDIELRGIDKALVQSVRPSDATFYIRPDSSITVTCPTRGTNAWHIRFTSTDVRGCSHSAFLPLDTVVAELNRQHPSAN